MIRLVPAVLLLFLGACASRGAIPDNQSSERPDWLPLQPEHYERYPVPESWRDNLAARPLSAAPSCDDNGASRLGGRCA